VGEEWVFSCASLVRKAIVNSRALLIRIARTYNEDKSAPPSAKVKPLAINLSS